jgi:hypothetical protein
LEYNEQVIYLYERSFGKVSFFDLLKSYKKRYEAKKALSGVKKVKTADKEGHKSGNEGQVSFDEGVKPLVKKPPASIVHKGNKYTFLAAYKYNAYALERQYILRDKNVDSILKKVNASDSVLYCIYSRKLETKATTGKPKKRASTKKRKFIF